MNQNTTRELLAIQAWSNQRWATQLSMENHGTPALAEFYLEAGQ